MHTKTRYLSACIMLATGLSSPLHAAESDGVATEEEAILITATKRAKSLQEVPVSVTAFTSENIENLGLTDSASVATQTPNLSWRSDFGTSSPNVFLRGIGNNSFHANAVGAVGIYTDGVYLNSNLIHGFQLFDLERIEVLRGPQGTLYGRNTTGGLINFIVKKPAVGDEFSAEATATLGNYNRRELDFAMASSLSDNTAVRFAAQIKKQDGFFESALEGQADKGDVDSIAWRLTGVTEFSDSVTASWTLHGADDDSDIRPFKSQGVECADGASPPPGFGNGCTDFFGFEESSDYHRIASALDTFQKTENLGASLTLEWEMDEFTLTAISAWEDVDRQMFEDTDRSPLEYFNGSYNASATQFSQELRLTSTTSGPLQWMAGLFYFDESMEQDEIFSINDFSLVAPGLLTQPLVNLGILPAPFAEEGVAFISEQDTMSYSAFAELEYSLNEQLKVTAGLRWTYDERDVNDYRTFFYNSTGARGQYLTFDDVQARGFAIADFPKKADWSELSGRITADYQVHDELLLYYSLSRGFKSGEYNPGALSFEPEFVIVDPEFITANELGFKSRFWQRDLTLNAALFHYNFTDQQVFTLSSIPGISVPVQTLTNAGKSEIQGFEAELEYTGSKHWYFKGGLAWLDTEFEEYDTVNPVTAEVTSFAGNEQPAAPTWNLNGIVRYYAELTSGAVISTQADFSFMDNQFFTADNNPSLTEDAYWLWNARVTYTSPKDDYSVSLWVKNLTDEEYITTAFDTAEFGVNSIGVGDPRTFGVTFSAYFE